MLSSAKKRYLFVIYELGENGNEVRSKDIASSLHVKRPSVSKMLGAMAEDNLIEKEYYGTVTFTSEGERLANQLYTRYLLLHTFFVEHLHVSADMARKDAILCLCDLSEDSIEQMALAVLSEKKLP